MDFSEVVRKRRSVRSYDSSMEISGAQLKQLFELVKHSPSSYNLQPWEFVVVRDKENKSRLKACANGQQHVEDASAVVIVVGSIKPIKNAAVIANDRMRKGLMDDAKKAKFDASVKMLSEDREKGKLWTLRSTPLAAMTLMLAAESMGIASCPMEGFDAECVRKEFEIPGEYEVVMLVTLGYDSGTKSERPMRFGYDKIVHHEVFGGK